MNSSQADESWGELLRDLEVDGIDSASCPKAGFDTGNAEPSSYAIIQVLIAKESKAFISHVYAKIPLRSE